MVSLPRRGFLTAVAAGGVGALTGLPATAAQSPAFPQSEAESAFDWETFTHEGLGTIDVKVHQGYDDEGVLILRLAVWAQRLVQEYRTYDFDGVARMWLYPDGETQEDDTGHRQGVANSGGAGTHIYYHHPSHRELEEIAAMEDPRWHHFFRALMHEYVHAESFELMGDTVGWHEHGFTEYTTLNHHLYYYRQLRDDVEADALRHLADLEWEREYAYGLFAIQFIVQEYGFRAVNELYAEMADHGGRPDQYAAVEAVFGIDLDTFTERFHATVTDWIEAMDGEPRTIDRRVVRQEDWLVREPGEVPIQVGSLPGVAYDDGPPPDVTPDLGQEPAPPSVDAVVEEVETVPGPGLAGAAASVAGAGYVCKRIADGHTEED